jgi:hypothetical protein
MNSIIFLRLLPGRPTHIARRQDLLRLTILSPAFPFPSLRPSGESIFSQTFSNWQSALPVFAIILSITLPIRCGTMCGGGVGDIIEMTKQLKVNMSIASFAKNPVSDYNLSLSDLGGNFSSLFSTQMTVYINSQQVSSDASPPCYNGFGEYQPNCASFTVQFPENSPGVYTLLVNSSEELVP